VAQPRGTQRPCRDTQKGDSSEVACPLSCKVHCDGLHPTLYIFLWLGRAVFWRINGFLGFISLL